MTQMFDAESPMVDVEMMGQPEAARREEPCSPVEDECESTDPEGGGTAADATPLQRTQSQVVKRIKVDEVAKSFEERREPVQRLRRVLSQLSAPSGAAEGEKPAPGYERTAEDLQQVEKLQQGFRDFGEDLMEGMLALDQLSGLADEDRQVRKDTLRGIQSLMDEIDGAKPRVVQLRRRLAAELERLKLQGEGEESPPEQPARQEAVGDASVPDAQHRVRQSEPPRPRVDWSRVRLPVEFSTSERGRAYILSSSIPGLQSDSIRLARKEGGVLSVQGLRLPNLSEQQALDRAIAARLQRLPRAQRQRLRQEDVDELAAQLGQGHFGMFQQIFEVPRDVDWQGVESSYEDGVFRVLLPRAAMTARGIGGHGHPGYQRRVPARGYPGMFNGGMSDFMW